MTDYQKELIVEHKELFARMNELANDIYGQNADDKIEYANKCIQLKGMKMYYEALSARLVNAGIAIDCGGYFEHITDEQLSSSTSPVEEIPTTENKPGSDFDKDNEAINQTTGENDNLK